MFDKICYLGLGSNLGNRENNIRKAMSKIEMIDGITLRKISSIIETKPYGKTDQPDFLNCVVEIETQLASLELLKKIMKIELELGRIRKEKWEARTIDIDILFFGEEIVDLENLKIPHPDIQNRQFVLDSLNEICPDLIHPVIMKKIKDIP
ncbi:MAG: 2-amino-4-hydroxy-6-hydroxymethyldihydropteridine diphosphokinase [Candidatus Cloacimonetes bacterium]|nr:2-amino-4-hydroxy-6-hydroxymethyldihydropteridine diphosphokinase [Candidatus Cloacimonadota bacterium]